MRRLLLVLLFVTLLPIGTLGVPMATEPSVCQEERPPLEYFLLQAAEAPPVITALLPASIDACSTAEERLITLYGHHFAGASLQIDGATVPAVVYEDEIVFTAPPLTGGLYEIRVVSATGQLAGHGLFVDDVPEILAVAEGEDRVNAYDLIVTGRNFFYTSWLVVDGAPVYTTAAEHRPLGEHLTYVDCNTLIYHRYPYSRVPKEVTLQVVNPGGRESPQVEVVIP